MSFRRAWTLLSKEEVAATAGFAVGFYGMFNPKAAFNEAPLSETFGGMIGGCLCGIGAGFLHSLMPTPLAPIIPFVSTVYCVNMLARDIRGLPRTEVKITIKVNNE